MKIILDIGHPKDVNVFKNVITSLGKKGHDVKIVARAKENTEKILKDYGFSCEYGPYYKSIIGKALGIPINDLWLYRIAKKFNPDIFISPGSPYSAHVSKILGRPHYAFIDTEIATLATKLMFPFTDKVYTSSSFYINLGPKQVKFNGYYELAYLHSEYFNPDKRILDKYGLEEEYIILRLSALASHHDINASGFSFKSERELHDYIYELEKYGRVIISSEKNDWETITKYQINFQSNDLHQVLYFAKMYIGEGASMASEAAILGTPSIYVSNTRRGYLKELEERYQLAYSVSTREEALIKVIKILEENDVRNKWHMKRDRMLNEKIDVVRFMVESIENYNSTL